MIPCLDVEIVSAIGGQDIVNQRVPYGGIDFIVHHFHQPAVGIIQVQDCIQIGTEALGVHVDADDLSSLSGEGVIIQVAGGADGRRDGLPQCNRGGGWQGIIGSFCATCPNGGSGCNGHMIHQPSLTGVIPPLHRIKMKTDADDLAGISTEVNCRALRPVIRGICLHFI